MIAFSVPLRAVGKARPRVTRHGVFTPAATKGFESAVAWAAKAAMGGQQPLDGPVALSVRIALKRPKSARKRAAPTTKPDIDNVAKAILDALNGIAFVDDARVTRLCISKIYDDADSVRVVIAPDEGEDHGGRL